METTEIKERLSVSQVLIYYGAKTTKYQYKYQCFRHKDDRPSLLANDQRGIANCMSSACEIKGMDIFKIIQLQTGFNFSEAKNEALRILGQGDIEAEPYKKKQDKYSQINYEKIPTLKPLNKYHKEWLENRYGKLSDSVIKMFSVRSYGYHIAVPIGNGSYVFIPTQEKDSLYYKGKNRKSQVFPYFPEKQIKATKILVCEGEKDVMMLSAFLKEKGEWSVVTNTNGAGNLREQTQLFSNFDEFFVDKVIIAYDNDKAGKDANVIAQKLAKSYFLNAYISVFQFPENAKEKYDMGDYIRDKYPHLFSV